MNIKRRIFSLFSAATIALSAASFSAADSYNELTGALAFSPVSVMDYDGDGIIGANDCRRLQKFLHGAKPENFFYDFDNDGNISAVDHALHKRAAIKGVPPEIITVTDEIPVKEYISIALHRNPLPPVADESVTFDKVPVPDIDDNIFSGKDDLEREVYQYLCENDGSDLMKRKYTDEFFEENALVFVASDLSDSLLERLSLSGGLISVEYFNSEASCQGDFTAIGVTVSKDVLARYSCFRAKGKNISTRGKAGKCVIETLQMTGQPEEKTEKWIDSVTELRELADNGLAGLGIPEAEAFDRLIGKYDEDFFAGHKLIVFSAYETAFFDDIENMTRFVQYDENNMWISIFARQTLTRPYCTLLFIELDSTICFEGQTARVNINDC